MDPEVADVLLAAAYEWAKPGSILKNTAWATENTMDVMAGDMCEDQRELNV